jgi:hypothetical protein
LRNILLRLSHGVMRRPPRSEPTGCAPRPQFDRKILDSHKDFADWHGSECRFELGSSPYGDFAAHRAGAAGLIRRGLAGC